MKEIFSSDRYFVFFDFLISHGQLLLRSQLRDDGESNIDVIFYNTGYIQSFIRLKGLRIRKVESEQITIDSDTVKKYLSGQHTNVFEIESNGEKYYIAASSVRVYENQLGFSQSSLGMLPTGREKEIATSH